MDQVRQVLRYHHYAYRTEQTYCYWILRFIKFHGCKTHPKDMGKSEIDSFLSDLATQGRVSAATQRQAMNAIVFLYRHVLDQPIADRIEPVRARRHARLPVIMTQEEVQQVLNMGHADVKTTEIYTHVMRKDLTAVMSPLDRLESRPVVPTD